MQRTYAEVTDNRISNIVLIDDENKKDFPQFVLIPTDENDNPMYGIGDGYDGEEWSKAVQAE